MLLPLVVNSQPMKERRVYYLDCSYSMVKPNNIWDEVCENLKNAINKIEDETTELMVIPFAYDTQHHHTLKAIRALATSNGKKEIIKEINAIKPTTKTKTFHCDPLSDFYNNRETNRVTYMFLMTDGADEDIQKKTVNELLPQWGGKYGNKNVFGFYVMLDKAARNINIENLIKKQQHLWLVETADINIRLIRLQNHSVFNVRNDHYIDLPIYGNPKGLKFSANFPESSPLTVKGVSIKGNHLHVDIESTINTHQLPMKTNELLHISAQGLGDYDFLVTENITVECHNKPERSLKISVR